MGNSANPWSFLGVASEVARFWLRTSIRTEEMLLELLPDTDRDPPATSAPTPTPAQPAAPSDPLPARMRTLLDRALDQNAASSQKELFSHILDQLVADEARIIGALSDGSRAAVVSVYDRTRSRGSGPAVLENASLIGRTANVALPEMVPAYVSHLLSLGLVRIGPEDPDLKEDYEVLVAEPAVLKASKAAARGPLAAKVDKMTLSLSDLGRALWDATMREDSM